MAGFTLECFHQGGNNSYNKSGAGASTCFEGLIMPVRNQAEKEVMVFAETMDLT